MYSYLLTARSLTYAQRYIKTLQREGIASSMLRTPSALSENGCGYCIRVTERNLYKAVSALEERGLSPKYVYRIIDENRYERVIV